MYQIREKAMEMALKWAECQINEVGHEALLKVAQDIKSYLEGTWGEPGGSEEEEQETRSDRLQANRRERDGLITLEFPDYLVYTMDFGISNTTKEQD